MAVSYTHLDVYKRQVLHRTSFIEIAEQTHKLVICRNGQPLDGMAAAVEGIQISCILPDFLDL